MNLTELRKILDDLDQILVVTLSKRMSYIPLVAMYKKENNIERYQPEREAEIIERKRKQAKLQGLDPDLVEDLMKTIIKYAHKIEKKYLK